MAKAENKSTKIGKVKINLIQDYETEFVLNSELNDLVSTKQFKDKLESELSERNLDEDKTNLITTSESFRAQDLDKKQLDYKVFPVLDENAQIGKAIAVSKIMTGIFNVNIANGKYFF